jgi:CubicO group peptidase (beta-lactamase class C family)
VLCITHRRVIAVTLVGLATPSPLLAQRASTRAPAAGEAAVYYPGPGNDWTRRSAREVGMDSARLADAIAFAIQRESRAPRDLEAAHYQTFGREPFGDGIGPCKERGDPTGLVVRHGYIVATWGDPQRVDMTFSVTKSFVSTTVGLAFDRGMIRNLKDHVRDYVAPVVASGATPRVGDRAARLGESMVMQPFETAHNRRITWDDLLRQTSDWEGTLWGKPEWADRPGPNPSEWRTRKRNDPGTTYEYNDVRVNVLALAALEVWRRPLPQVLKEHVMDPIGASNTWRWYGYDNSWVLLDGQAVQSVSGGGHWGGGMFINARDMARFGYLTLRRGRWRDRVILSEAWVRQALTPTAPQPTYGFMNWFVNTDRKFIASAPASAFAHMGNGTNMIYVDPENDLVVVVRWIENGAVNEFVQRVLASIVGREAKVSQ